MPRRVHARRQSLPGETRRQLPRRPLRRRSPRHRWRRRQTARRRPPRLHLAPPPPLRRLRRRRRAARRPQPHHPSRSSLPLPLPLSLPLHRSSRRPRPLRTPSARATHGIANASPARRGKRTARSRPHPRSRPSWRASQRQVNRSRSPPRLNLSERRCVSLSCACLCVANRVRSRVQRMQPP